MEIEDTFSIDAVQSAFVLGASWQGEQIDRVVELRRSMSRLEAEEVRVLAALLYEAEGEAAETEVETGAPGSANRRHDLAVRSLATELAAATNTSLPSVEKKLGEAWTLSNELHGTLTALETGEISRAHAHELIAATAHLGSARRDAEAVLLPWAKRLAVAPFARKARLLLETLEKEPLKARHERALAKRRVDITGTRDGMAHLEAYVDGADAALIKVGLENAAQEARAAGDPRTGKQLEADLLVGLVLDGKVAAGDAGLDATGAEGAGTPVTRRAPVTVEVLIPAETLAGKDEQGAVIPGFGVIDPERARELVAMAPTLKRILIDPITGAAVNFDRTSYRIPAELKRVLRLRDGHCRAPGCTAPLEFCELDHTIDYARGGPTSLGNLAHLCANHHHLKHEAGWSVRHRAGGVLDWRAPSGHEYRTWPDNPWEAPSEVTEPAPFDAPGVEED